MGAVRCIALASRLRSPSPLHPPIHPCSHMVFQLHIEGANAGTGQKSRGARARCPCACLALLLLLLQRSLAAHRRGRPCSCKLDRKTSGHPPLPAHVLATLIHHPNHRAYPNPHAGLLIVIHFLSLPRLKHESYLR